MMKSNQVNKKTGRDEMYEMEWRIEFGSGHQPGADGAVDPFNLAFAHRALFAAIKEEDPGAMLISEGARFKLPEEIPVEDATYEAAFSPTKITPRRTMGRSSAAQRWVVCHKIVSKFQHSRELKEALWEYLRESNVWMRFSKLGVGSTTAVGWLKNFHPVLQNRDHLADRLSLPGAAVWQSFGGGKSKTAKRRQR